MKKYFILITLLTCSVGFSSIKNISAEDSLLFKSIINPIKYAPIAVPYEHIPDVEYDIVAERLSCIETEIPMHFNQRVKGFVTYFAIRDRTYTKMVISRKDKYFPLFEKYLKKYGLPDELKYLAVVESGLKAEARSRVGAVGLWQFMPATGRMFGLHNGIYIDDRMDPEKSTEAAVKYLKSLFKMFGDWELALASYNAGPGNVRKAIRRSGYKRDFWSIYNFLPRETRSYVPQFAAIFYVLNHLPEHNFIENDYDYGIESDTVMVKDYVHLKTLSALMGVCEGDLEKINPGLRRGVVPQTRQGLVLNIPQSEIEYFKKHRNELLDSAGKIDKKKVEYIAMANPRSTSVRSSSSSTANRKKILHNVQSGDVIGTIAERYHVGVSDIRYWNNLRSNIVRVDQQLAIWVKPGVDINKKQSSSIPKPVLTFTGKKTHTVQEGDTLWDISRKYDGISIETLKKLNKLSGNRIKPGQTLIIG